MGMSKNEFFHSTPKILQAYDKAYLLRLEERDRENWHLGMYLKSAIISSFEKSAKYIEKPFLSDIHLSEEEKKQKALDEFVAKLQAMQESFNAIRKD